MKSAILVHLLGWRSERTEFELDGGVTLCRTEGTEVERLYHHLCEAQKIDEGDPFNFPSHILLSDEAHDDFFADWGGPFSAISRCCNIIAICTSSPLGMCRLLTTKDDFHSEWIPSQRVYDQGPDLAVLRGYPDFLEISSDTAITVQGEHFPALDDEIMRRIAVCWSTHLRLLSTRDIDNHRIDNALSYFFYSWRSYYLDHVCLNLAIVLESLFAPSSAQEVSHQIAFNVSRFCEKNPVKREDIYKTIKKFYAVRSQIVHGGRPRNGDLFAQTPRVFHLCARILDTILSDYALAQRFCHEEKRRTLFSEWLFGG